MSQQGNVSRYDWITGNNYNVRTLILILILIKIQLNAAIGQDPLIIIRYFEANLFIKVMTRINGISYLQIDY